jgi:hypothetical protein
VPVEDGAFDDRPRQLQLGVLGLEPAGHPDSVHETARGVWKFGPALSATVVGVGQSWP